MTQIDPENNETRALLDMVNFRGEHVLEIGCGDGRLTWRYADKPAHVTAIEPSADQIGLAQEKLPNNLQGRVEFHAATLEDFAANSKSSIFDIAILSYSLC
jgi:2-polyprenyl-3-methyl-5-hydroxy-6-metoxy-1,4-benzoquinol methylase